MAKNQKKAENIEIQIKTIEVLNFALHLPANSNIPFSNFNFNINLEIKADAPKKLVFGIVHVEIKNDKEPTILGSLTSSCIFEISNFEKVVKLSPRGKLELPSHLIEKINAVSISTTRGILFSTFKGTFLQDAVLPLMA